MYASKDIFSQTTIVKSKQKFLTSSKKVEFTEVPAGCEIDSHDRQRRLIWLFVKIDRTSFLSFRYKCNAKYSVCSNERSVPEATERNHGHNQEE